MKKQKIGIIIFLCVLSLFLAKNSKAQEVPKGGIPEDLLETSLKELSSGIKIWDEEETMAALNGDIDVLLVDTRPRSFFNNGTFKNAIFLIYNKDEQLSDVNKNETAVLTKESLEAAMAEAGVDTVMFFCQGPKCHRSYNAALRSVSTWGLSVENVVWGRAGYPGLLKYIQADSKLARKMNKYFKGSVLSQ